MKKWLKILLIVCHVINVALLAYISKSITSIDSLGAVIKSKNMPSNGTFRLMLSKI